MAKQTDPLRKRISAKSAAIGPAKFLLGCVVLIFHREYFPAGRQHRGHRQHALYVAGGHTGRRHRGGRQPLFHKPLLRRQRHHGKAPVRGERRDSHTAARHGHNRDNREPGARLGGAGGAALDNRQELQGAHPGRQRRHGVAHTRERADAGKPRRRRHPSLRGRQRGAGGDDPGRDA